MADPERLIATFYWLTRYGGPAVGADGMRFRDVGRREIPEMMRALSDLLLSEQYRPGPRRHLDIPKPTGGTRTLSLPDMLERIVARSMTDVLTPFLDPKFHDWSLGFRPRRSCWDMLIAIEEATAQGLYVIVNSDIRKAFDNVPIGITIEAFQQHLTDPRLVSLTDIILRGHERSQLGIAQGSAISPLALNALLHHHLDLLMDRDGVATIWRRYADNLVYLRQDVTGGRDAHQRAMRLLEVVGMTLKAGTNEITDLRTGTTDLLGFRLGVENGTLQVSTPPTSWDTLQTAITDCHEADDPRGSARQVIEGWMAYQAPALGEAVDDTVTRILQTAGRAGIYHLDRRALLEGLRIARERWDRFRRGRTRPLLDRALAAAPPAAYRFSAWAYTGVIDSCVGDSGPPFNEEPLGLGG